MNHHHSPATHLPQAPHALWGPSHALRCLCLLATADLLPVTVDQFVFPTVLRKWNHSVTRINILRLIYVALWTRLSFLLKAEQNPIAWKRYSLHIPSLVDGRERCFLFGAITNKTAMDTYVQVFVGTCASHYSWGVKWLDHLGGICLSF